MLGGVNHPHVEHLALAMHERGFDVVVAGDAVQGLPPSALPAAGIPVRAAPAGRRGSLRGAAAHVRWIRRLVRDEAPDVVHAHWLCGFACFAALARARPLVSMAWGSDVLLASRAKLLADRVALRSSALAMADSLTLIDRLVTLGADPARTVLVNWGVDLERFRPASTAERLALRAELGLAAGPVILSMRSLMPVYNPEVVLAAWARVAAGRPDAQLVVKHMGPVSVDLGELPFADRVHVVGHVPYERMAAYYRAADAAVSIASSDSAPRSVFEAMACAVPCVLADLPWAHEQLRDGQDALLVPIREDTVAGALGRILDDPATASELASNGRRLAERHHDRNRHMDRLAGTYREVASGRTPTR